jgi:16S rRNA (adenine1518-N6/adenine1519-N6)-dimethyltransferase
VEVGAGLGSLTVALAATGARVLAIEVDERLLAALREAVGATDRVEVVRADAARVDWKELLGVEPWIMVANLPYNVATPVVMRVLEEAPNVQRMLVMVQREVGERLAAGPGDEQYGAVSLRVAYRADASVVRPVARTVFWPQPNVDSVLVRIERRPPPVRADERTLMDLIRVSFAQRRKTVRNALLRFGMASADARAALEACGVGAGTRPEELGLEAFACLADAAGQPGSATGGA